jgi:hypothetical protein
MKLHSRVRDCLFLNWALPADRLPPAPAPLRYEIHDAAGEPRVLLSVVCLRQEGSYLDVLPSFRLGFAQFNIRSYVVDADGVPSVLFHEMLVPYWVWPAVRLIARQPVSAAVLSGPATGSEPPWTWSVSGTSGFACRAEPSSPGVIEEVFGSWQDLVSSIRSRDRGYVRTAMGIRRLQTRQPTVEAIPVAVELVDTSRLEANLDLSPLPPLLSAFLCPEIPLTLEFEKTIQPLRSQAPVPG